VAQFRFSYNVLSGFLLAREEAVDLLSEFVAEEQDQQLRSLFLSAVMAVNEDIAAVRAYIVLLRQEDYELHASLTTMVAARTVLNAQRRMVRHLQHDGVLERAEADRLSGRVDASMERLMRHPPLIHLPDNLALLRRVHWLHEASETLLRGLVNGDLGPPLEELTLEGGEMAVGQGQFNDAVYILKRGTLLVVNTPKNSRKEVEVDQLLLGSTFNVLPFALTQPAANGIRAAGQVTLLKLPGPALRALVSTSTVLEEALWNGVGKQAAEGVLANIGGLAKWQLERIACRLESHVVGGELEEVQFIKTAVVVLVSGGAAFTTAVNTMIDWSKQPDRAWDVPYSCAPTQLKPPQCSSSTSPFFRVVLRAGSRFVAEEDSIHSRVRISHRPSPPAAAAGSGRHGWVRPPLRGWGGMAPLRAWQSQQVSAADATGCVQNDGRPATRPQAERCARSSRRRDRRGRGEHLGRRYAAERS